MMKYLVTGGAGFIGSNLVDALTKENSQSEICVVDNLSMGKEENISHHKSNKKFSFIKADLLSPKSLVKAMPHTDVVFHLSANSDISYGAKHTDHDLKQGTIATYNVLESMRLNDVRNLVFSSSSAIYGDTSRVIAEDFGPLMPISFYGASKLACEGLISAFSHNYGIRVWICRFPNVVGTRGTHGVVVDFIRKLKADPKMLKILGNGRQEKPYIHVSELLDAMFFIQKNSSDPINYFNIGPDGTATTVKKIAEIVVEEMKLRNVQFKFTGGERGWKGDVPKFQYDISKIKNLGWNPHLSSDEAVRKAVKELVSEVK